MFRTDALSLSCKIFPTHSCLYNNHLDTLHGFQRILYVSETIVDCKMFLINRFFDRALTQTRVNATRIDSGIKDDRDSSTRLRSLKQNNITSHQKTIALYTCIWLCEADAARGRIFLPPLPSPPPQNKQATEQIHRIYGVCITELSCNKHKQYRRLHTITIRRAVKFELYRWNIRPPPAPQNNFLVTTYDIKIY